MTMVVPQLIDRHEVLLEVEIRELMDAIYPDGLEPVHAARFHEVCISGMCIMLGQLQSIARQYGQSAEGDIMFKALSHAADNLRQPYIAPECDEVSKVT